MAIPTLTLTLIGKSGQNPNQRNRKGKEKDEEGNLPGPPDTAVAQKATTVRVVVTAAMVGARTEARLGRGSGQRSKAARRRRAHPLGSAHAGEGAGDGAGTSLLRHGCSLGDSLR